MAEAFPTSGNIDPTSFPFLIMDLHRRGATGSLKVEGPSHPKALYFRGGRILFGSSNDPRDQLGSILIEQGKITQDQLDEVNAKVGPGNPLAKVLAESGFVNQRELGDAARIKVERILSDVIVYTSGSFEFEDGVLPKGAVDLKLSTEKLLIAAVARITDRSFVLRYIDSLAVVLAPAPDVQERIGEIRGEVAPLLDRLDGKRALKDAVALTRLDEFEAAKIACSLLFLGMVGPAAPASAEADSSEVDLASTARIAFGDAVDAFAAPPKPAPASHPPPSDVPFFVPEAPAPVAAESPLVMDVTRDDIVAGGSESGPEMGLFVPDEAPPSIAVSPEPATPAGGLEFGMAEPVGHEASSAPGSPGGFEADDQSFSLSEPGSGTLPSLPAYDPPPPVASFDPPPPVPKSPPSFAATMPNGVSVSPSEAAPSFDMDISAAPHLREHDDAVPPSRPSKEDLAALDALLNPMHPSASQVGRARPVERARPQQPERERWEPQFRPAAAPRRPPARTRRIPVVRAVLLVTLAAAAGAGYYFALNPPGSASPGTAPPKVTTPATTPPASVAVAPSTSPPPDSVASAAPSSAPPMTTAPPVASAPPPSTPAPPAPSTPSPAKPTGSSDPRVVLRAGGLADAARGFATDLRGKAPGHFSVQLLVACSEDTVHKAVAAVTADELFILPVNYKGKSCYRVCWGVYGSEAEAASAGRSLPEYFVRGGANPKVSPVAGLLP
jgi:septal ring-binding cell division protein DamX